MRLLRGTIHLLLISVAPASFSQAFANRDFEQAVIVPISTDSIFIDTAKALPNWNVTADGKPIDGIFYNDVSLSGGAVTLQSTASSFKPIVGNYSVMLQDINFASPNPFQVALSHSDTLDSKTVSLYFRARVYAGAEDLRDLSVSFAGHRLRLFEISNSADYNTYGADISEFAGTPGILEFAPLNRSMVMLDSITFSPLVIPEPGIGISILLGTGLLLRMSKCTRLKQN